MARNRSLFAAPVVALLVIVACSDDANVANSPDAGSANDASSGTSPDGAAPALECVFPLSPCDETCHNTDYDARFCGACNRACASGESCIEQRCTRTVFAIRKLFLGETDRLGAADANAWKQYGANLDNLVSTGAATKECKPVDGASASSGLDGDNGIDNSWGANVVPLLQPFVATPSMSATTTIEAGGRTPLIAVGDGIGGDGAGNVTTAASPVLSAFGFAETMPAPKWDGSDVRHFAYDWTKDNRVSTILDKGTYRDGVFVSSPAATPVPFDFVLGDLKFNVPIHALQVWFTLTSNDAGATTGAVEGSLSGYIVATELANAIAGAAGRLREDLCSGPTVEALKTEVIQTADILSDGTQDASKTCDAISIGLGFEAALVQSGDFAAKVAPAPDPCQH
jgi:hypothetical protein